MVTAGSNGTKVNEYVVAANGNTAAGLVFIWTHDGTNFRLWDVITVRVVTGSTTAAPYRSTDADCASGTRRPLNCVLKSGWTLRASMSVAPTTGSLFVHVQADDA